MFMDEFQVKENEEEIIDLVFSILKHPIRRKILNILWKRNCAFLELSDICERDHGKLGYHLRKMGRLLEYDEIQKEYKLASEGRLVYQFISQGIISLRHAFIQLRTIDEIQNDYSILFEKLLNILPV